MHIALIDDDEAVLDSLRLFLTRNGIETSCFTSADLFASTLDGDQGFDCIIADVRMPGMSGLELVDFLSARSVHPTIILITGHGDVEMAVSALKKGALDFIEKPFDERRLLDSIGRAKESNPNQTPGLPEPPRSDLESCDPRTSRARVIAPEMRQAAALRQTARPSLRLGSKWSVVCRAAARALRAATSPP
jgi:FixJ family two-component response regulator